MEREQCVQAKAKCHVGKAATSRDHEGLKGLTWGKGVARNEISKPDSGQGEKVLL